MKSENLKQQLILKMAEKAVPPAVIAKILRSGFVDMYHNRIEEITTVFWQPDLAGPGPHKGIPKDFLAVYTMDQEGVQRDQLTIETINPDQEKHRFYRNFNYRIGDKNYGDSTTGVWQPSEYTY